jgi:transposase
MPIVQQQTPPPPDSKREELRDAIEAMYEADLDMSSPDIVQKLYDEDRIEVSRYTVWRTLTLDLGLRFKKAKVIPALGDPAARLAFVKRFGEIMAEEDPVVIWTDETMAGCNDYRVGGFRKRGEDGPSKRKERWAPKVHCWGALWESGAYVVRLHKGEGTRGGLVKAQYLKFIAQHMRNLIARVKRTAGQRPIYWMQDGASVHGKAETQALCAKHGIRFVDGWPAHSPDLNPLENFWAILKRAIGKEVQLFKNTEENRDKIVTKVDGHVKRVNPRMCQRLCSVGKRFKKVRENKGKF